MTADRPQPLISRSAGDEPEDLGGREAPALPATATGAGARRVAQERQTAGDSRWTAAAFDAGGSWECRGWAEDWGRRGGRPGVAPGYGPGRIGGSSKGWYATFRWGVSMRTCPW